MRVKYKDIDIEISKRIEQGERVLWQGTNEKTTYFKTAKLSSVVRDLILLLVTLSLFAICIVCAGSSSAYVVCPAVVLLPMSLFKSFHPDLYNKFYYVITDKNVYVFVPKKLKNKKDKAKNGNLDYVLAFGKVPTSKIDHISIETNRDGTATLNLSRREFSYTGLNWRAPYDQYKKRKNMKSRIAEEENIIYIAPLFNLKNHESAVKCITQFMNQK